VSCVADDQIRVEVEYRMSYDAAVPVVLSSPGAVQFRVIEVWLMNDVARSLMLEGGVVSGITACKVVNVLFVEIEVLLFASLDFTL